MRKNAPRAYYNRVREYRNIVGLTQRELSLATGVAFPTLARLDAHRSAMPSVEVAILLARAFGVDVPSLITEKL
jgi:transcriptional regulator with XRE-family HTH domain